jgi:hypothetical protein
MFLSLIPAISDQFLSINDIGLYRGVNILLEYIGRRACSGLYRTGPAQWPFFISLFTFALGSTFCGAAGNSPTLIIGRGLVGLGSGGVLVGINTMLVVLSIDDDHYHTDEDKFSITGTHRRQSLYGVARYCPSMSRTLDLLKCTASITGPLYVLVFISARQNINLATEFLQL